MHNFAILILALATPAFAKTGDGDWGQAYDKAAAALAKLSTNEKISIVVGTNPNGTPGRCIGETAAVPSIAYPQFCLLDGPLAVHAANATVFPAGIQVASTWDTSLMYARGKALGSESKAAGVHVLFGPSAGPLGKIPAAGRNWEGFSPDPYLAGISMANTINGMQAAGVQACAKHLIDYEQDTNRNKLSSNVDDRTNHELYLWPFADAVRANVTSVMCSTNLVNHTLACQNKVVLQSLLKDELDFQGFVVSDWAAHNSTADAVNAGLDVSMPTDAENNSEWGVKRESLAEAISSGKVPVSRLDDMVRRTLAAWYFLGQDVSYPTWKGVVPDMPTEHRQLARVIARDGIVLLKNDGALPLKQSARLAVIGEDAVAGNGKDTGTLVEGGGSGSWPGFNDPMPSWSFVAPIDALARTGTVVANSTTNDLTAGASAASAAETAVVFIKSYSGENNDRESLNPDNGGDNLVTAVSKTGKPTIVVIHSVGPLILETIAALPNIKAVVWAGVPGQESGNALVDVLYGKTTPSGKLPYTIAKSEADYGTAIVNGSLDDSFPEGLYIDYRRFDANEIKPRFEFGFGLSYTTFDYSNLSVSYSGSPDGHGKLAPGGFTELYDTVATVAATITNNGSRIGAEVAQLYIGLPESIESAHPSPRKQLRGFSKIMLEPGRKGTAMFQLRRKDLSYWDVSSQKWLLPDGTFKIYVGSSSRDIRLSGSMSTAPTVDAYSTIQAEAHTTTIGTQIEATSDTDGGYNVGWIHNGDQLGYMGVEFGSQGATGFTARIASGAEGGANGTVLVTLDSPMAEPICSLSVANTGGWQNWTSMSASISRVTGRHTVYLVFASGQGSGFMNVNWFKFSR